MDKVSGRSAMPEEVLPDIYRIEVPLPKNPLKYTNAYLIKGSERHLLVDTGFNWSECLQALKSGLKLFNASLDKIDFFITHLHGDHSGLVYQLCSSDARVYCSRVDAELLMETASPAYGRESDRLYNRHGFPANMLGKGYNKRDYISGEFMNYVYLNPKDRISVGSYRFEAILTPGHSPGHLCLYEPFQQILISGDHILDDITPNITAWPNVNDSLGSYLNSLEQIQQLHVRMVLPGHRGLIHNCAARVRELQEHHRVRLNEIMQILANGAQTAYQVAGSMTWDMHYKNWNESPLFQRWFATGEAIAHLEYLHNQGQVKKSSQEKHCLFSLP
jgi:glyoxylase-like metal-dependent hydrolase (beta-lactamase superfamily II)